MSQPAKVHIRLEQYSVGKDRVFMITGGDAHIGAVATGFRSNGVVTVESCTVPGHREGPLAEAFARVAASKLDCTVTVIMGIHIDNASKEDIRFIETEVERMMKRVLDS